MTFNSEAAHKKQRHLAYKQPKLKEAAIKYASRLVSTETNAEAFLKALLLKADITFEDQKIVLGNHVFYIADFYLPDYHLIIELDGKHHYTPEGIIKDSNRDSILRELGFDRILRIPNNEAFNLTETTLLDILTITE